jgi:uncharacterized membrane protein YqjE
MMAELHVTPDRTADGSPPTPEGPPLGELLRQLAQDSAVLVRQEIALAKVEVQQNVKHVVRDVSMITVGAVLAAVGGLVLVAFLVILLGSVLNNYWLGALIVGALFVIVGGALAMANLKRLQKEEVAPTRTLETLKEDKQWLQSEIRQARRDLA